MAPEYKWASLMLFTNLRIVIYSLFLSVSGAQAKPLELFHWWVSPAEQKLLEQLNSQAKMRSIPLQTESLKGIPYVDYYTTLEKRIEAHHPPDAAQLSGYRLAAQYMTGIERPPVTPQWEEWIATFTQNAAKHNGEWMGVPISVHGLNWLWVNHEHWQRLGLAPPESWPDLIHALELAKRQGLIGLAVSGHKIEAAMLFNVVAMGSMGEETFRRIMVDNQLAASDAKILIEVFERLSQLRQYIPDNQQQLSSAQALALMSEGKALMRLQGTWANAMLVSQGLAPQVDFDCFRFPDTQSMPIFISDIIVFYEQGPSTPALRRQLAELLIDKEFQLSWSLLSGGLPARVDIGLEHYNECAQQVMKDMRSPHMRETTLFFKSEQRQPTIEILSDHFHDLLSNEQAVEKLLQVLGKAG